MSRRAGSPEAPEPRRFALKPLPCARCRKVEASLGEQIIDGARLGWLCRQCSQQHQSPEVRS